MITELMLILILVGAGIIFVVWQNSRKRQRTEHEQKEVEESTSKFKKELENTANEIIGRMENQAAHLESLLDDSERNRTQLEGRVMELKKLLKRSEGQSTEIRDLLARLDDAVEDVNSMQKQMDAVERKINAAINVQIPQPMQQPVLNTVPQMMNPLINPLMTAPQMTQATVPQMPAVNPIQSPITPPPILRTQPPPVEQKPEENFSKVLEKSLEEEKTPAGISKPVRPPDRDSIVVSRETKQRVKVVEADPVKIETPSKRVGRVPKSGERVLTKLPGSIAERQAKVLAERQERVKASVEMSEEEKTSADIRKAAVEAINKAVENENTIDVGAIEDSRTVSKNSAVKSRTEKDSDRYEIPKSEADSVNIRNMLLAGMSVEEIARETGLGRGAIELVQQMARRQLERN